MALLLNSEEPHIFSGESVSDFSWHPKGHQNKLGAVPECSSGSSGTLAGSREGLKKSTPLSYSWPPVLLPGLDRKLHGVWSLGPYCSIPPSQEESPTQQGEGVRGDHNPWCHSAPSCKSLWDSQGRPASVPGIGNAR